MKYEADEQYFEVNINRFLVFKLNIPRGEAQKFKDNVKNLMSILKNEMKNFGLLVLIQKLIRVFKR